MGLLSQRIDALLIDSELSDYFSKTLYLLHVTVLLALYDSLPALDDYHFLQICKYPF